MYCFKNIARFSALPLQCFDSHRKRIFCSYDSLSLTNKADRHRNMAIKVSASKSSSDYQVQEKLSQEYSEKMTEASDAVLSYRHEEGMNYTQIRSDMIVGSCLQSPADVDKLRAIGVKTIFCLQEDPDLEYFGVDIRAIQRYAATFDDIEHVRAEIRDFDPYDLRLKLPAVISKLYKAIERNGGVTYIHCTAGMGRAPSVALAYLFWVQGYQLSKGHSLIVTQRKCSPKVDAIKAATADILTGREKKRVTLTLKEDLNCSSVEIVGLDVGWEQRLPLRFDASQLLWVLERELHEGRYEYKYIVDGDVWKYDDQKPTINNGGHINNYIDVFEDDSSERSSTLKRIFDDDGDLLPAERLIIKQLLESYPDQ